MNADSSSVSPRNSEASKRCSLDGIAITEGRVSSIATSEASAWGVSDRRERRSSTIQTPRPCVASSRSPSRG